VLEDLGCKVIQRRKIRDGQQNLEVTAPPTPPPHPSTKPLAAQRVHVPLQEVSNVVQKGLEARGCVVTRLDTYDTVPVTRLDAEAREAARGAGVTAIASPSAVNAWVELVGGPEQADVAFACIGESVKGRH